MSGVQDVQTRIAMLQGRFAGATAVRGGGRVGHGMEEALAAASAASPGATVVTAAASVPAPTTTPQVTAPGSAWTGRLPADGQPYAASIEAAATRHGLEPSLLGALVWTESSFDASAVSPAGAIGLGQLMPGTAAELGVDPTDPEANVDGAARYLRQQLDRFGDTRLALAAYNAGPGRVAAAGGVPDIPETTNYVARVTQRAALLGGTA